MVVLKRSFPIPQCVAIAGSVVGPYIMGVEIMVVLKRLFVPFDKSSTQVCTPRH